GYGSAGIGWALGRLGGSDAADPGTRRQWRDLAGRAVGTAARLLDAPEPVPAGWCHGAAGLGLAALDRYARDGRTGDLDLARAAADRAVAAGPGPSVTPCHGDA